MLRSSRALAQAAPLARKRLFSQTATSATRPRQASQGRVASGVASAATAAIAVWLVTRDEIHNDAIASAVAALGKTAAVTGFSIEDGSLATLIWGSNKCVSADVCLPTS